MDIRDKSEEQRNSLEKLLSVIPGFGGYYERDTRRNADAVQRRYTADRLDEVRRDVQRLITKLSDLKRIGTWGKVEQTVTRLSQTIRFAEYGYSGFFDTLKIGDEELDKLYDIDAEVLQKIEDLRASLTEDLGPDEVLEILLGIEEGFSRRMAVIREVG